MTATRYRCNCGEMCDSHDELAEHQGTCSEARSSGGAYREMATETKQLPEGWAYVTPPPPADWKPCDCITTIICGRSSHVEEAEAHFAALREGQETPGLFTGCGVGQSVLTMYRCIQCARWMHRECLRRHFETSTHADAGEDQA